MGKDGARKQISTKTKVRSEATKIADAWEQAYRHNQTETQVRNVLSGIIEELYAKPLVHVTLAQYFATWLARIKPEIKPNTFNRYAEITRQVTSFAPEVTGKFMDKIESADIVTIRNRVHKARASGTTNLTMKILRQCMKAAADDSIIPRSPAENVSGVRKSFEESGADSKRPFTLDELSKILAVADDEWRGMILAGYHSAGQRLSDIATLRAEQVDLKAEIVKFATDKTGRTVVIPISAEWMADLKKRAEGKAGPLFPRANATFMQKRKVAPISNQFRALLARVDLATKPNRAAAATPGRRVASPLSFHSFRHTATSLLKRAGVSDSVVMDIVGHDSEAVSQNYTHIDDATKRAALAKLPGIG